jgi:hypothetical protein
VQGFSADALLGLSVRLRGILIGRPVDVIVDLAGRRALGLDVLCKDEEHRFLPWSAAAIGGDEIAVSSSLTLLAAEELAFYRKRARTLRALRGAPVTRAGRELGPLDDILVATDGTIDALVVAGRRRPLDDLLQVVAKPDVDAA